VSLLAHDFERVCCDACAGCGCPVCNGVGWLVFDPRRVEVSSVKRVPKWDGRVALMRKLPDGRLEVIGEVVGEDEWNDAREAVLADLAGDESVTDWGDE